MEIFSIIALFKDYIIDFETEQPNNLFYFIFFQNHGRNETKFWVVKRQIKHTGVSETYAYVFLSVYFVTYCPYLKNFLGNKRNDMVVYIG